MKIVLLLAKDVMVRKKTNVTNAKLTFSWIFLKQVVRNIVNIPKYGQIHQLKLATLVILVVKNVTIICPLLVALVSMDFIW